MTEKAIQSLAGTEDRLPPQWTLWHRLHRAARNQFELHGYGELSTPIIEDARLFIKGTGEDTEIVEKQMYSISSSEGEEANNTDERITLRPEGTPPAVRAYLEADLHKKQKFQKFWYAGPMFRRERPQKGRLRQFHQIGVEAIGGSSPLVDAETILLADAIYKEAGLSSCAINVNSIGCPECRPKYRQILKDELAGRADELCPDCEKRLDRNVLRILDCKEKDCREVVDDLPPIPGLICDECTTHYQILKDALSAQSIAYVEDPLLVRGLDYYTRTVYEIKHKALGARDTICGGGRYDGLVSQLGGPETPCVGFAMGVEATLIAMEAESDKSVSQPNGIDVYVVCFDDSARAKCFEQVEALRSEGLSADMDYEERSSKAQMRMADKTNADFCLLIGELELEKNEVTIKDMKKGEQWTADWDAAGEEISSVIKA